MVEVAAKKTEPALIKKPESDGKQTDEAIVTASVDEPPLPVRRPYRKIRSRKSPAKTPGKTVEKTAKPALSKTVSAEGGRRKEASQKVVERLPTNTIEKTVVIEPDTVEVGKPAMVPVQVIPVQIMPTTNAPQDIVDAFNDTSSQMKTAVPDAAPEKVAEAETVAIEPSFGQSEHLFSGQ
jgi:hypothetical protein